MVYKYDEIISVLQTEGDLLEEKKEELKAERYKYRFSGIYKDTNSPNKLEVAKQRETLENMTPEKFEKKRLEQAMQLYCKYKSNRVVGNITPGYNFATRDRIIKTSIESVRRATGKYSERGIYNTDILYLDSNTIEALEAIAYAESEIGDKRLEIDGISSVQLLDVVDDLIATREIIGERYLKLVPNFRVFATDTDTLKRSIGFKKGKNVYGIDDYSVTVEQMLSNKSNIFKKTYKFLKNKWKEINKDPNEPEYYRFGDRQIYLDDGERG